MSNVGSSRASASSDGVLTLVHWPLRDEKFATAAWTAALLAAGAASASLSGSWPMGLVVLAALLLASWRRWVPVTLQIEPRGVVESALGRRRRIAWSQVAQVEVFRQGVLLVMTPERGLLAPLDGLFLRGGRDTEQLARVVLESWERARRPREPSPFTPARS